MDDDGTDESYLVAVRRARAESVEFFSSSNRAERELWVANEFLANLGIEFEDCELTHVTDDPPDVRFRSAAFEIKEVLDEGRRRHAEFKASLEKANAARTPSDLLEPVTPRDITYAEVWTRIEARTQALAIKYAPCVRSQLDLLFYINLEDVFGYISTPLQSSAQLEPHGFRSVSCVMGRLAGVLMVTDDAPDFLLSGGLRVVARPRTNE